MSLKTSIIFNYNIFRQTKDVLKDEFFGSRNGVVGLLHNPFSK